MRRYLAVVFFSIFMMLVVTNAMSSSDDFFTRDPEATYDKNYDNFDLVVEIPGHKLYKIGTDTIYRGNK